MSFHEQLAILPVYLSSAKASLLILEGRDTRMRVLLVVEERAPEVMVDVCLRDVLGRFEELEGRFGDVVECV